MPRFILSAAALSVAAVALMSCVPGTRPGGLEPTHQEEDAVSETVYTLGEWRVRAGQEAAFIAAWKELGEVFTGLPHPPGPGTLIRSMSEPALFYSFGPWDRMEHVEEMRRSDRAREALQRLVALCTEATPGTFRLVAEVPSTSGNWP